MLVDNSTWDYKFLFQFWDVLNIDYNTLEIELNWNKKMREFSAVVQQRKITCSLVLDLLKGIPLLLVIDVSSAILSN